MPAFPKVLFFILLIEGFITISVEILTMRQLLPFFGGSVVITSIIIGIFLLFLALGYWRGGAYQQDFFNQLSRNFIFSMLWIGIGLSYGAIVIFCYLSIYKAHFYLLPSLFLYLLLVLAPIVYWLGQTIPLTTNLFNQKNRISSVSGHALFLSTLGSFLGALLTSLLFFQYFGVAWTVVFNCALLFALIIYIRIDSDISAWQVSCVFFALLFIMLLNIQTEHVHFKRTNNYGNYRVIEAQALSKILEINHSNSSLLTSDNKGFPYIEFIRDLLFNQLNIQYKQLLIIGAGGFSLTADGVHNNEVTYIDIDPDIKKLAEEHFLHQPIKGRFIAQDARSYLQNNYATFDVIVSDVYSNQATIPPSLLTVEYFQAIANHLNQEGVAIINIIANPSFGDNYARNVFNTIHAAFSYCTVVPLGWKYANANILYICSNVVESQALYRDDLSTATLDFLNRRVV